MYKKGNTECSENKSSALERRAAFPIANFDHRCLCPKPLDWITIHATRNALFTVYSLQFTTVLFYNFLHCKYFSF